MFKPQSHLRSVPLSLVTRQGSSSLLLGFGASYQGEPGTGVEATGLLPFAALSSPVTRIDGGSFQQKEKESAVLCFYLNTRLQ